MQRQPNSRDPFDTLGTSDYTSFNQGVPQHVVQRLLGHASPQMTATYANPRKLHPTRAKAQVGWS